MAEQPRDIESLFDQVARRYDLMNRLMTFGRDRTWRRFLVRQLRVEPGMRVLDVACGTGDLIEELRDNGVESVTGLDFSAGMLARANHRFGGSVSLVQGDALDLPFEAATFDRVVSGFLIRNASSVHHAFAEQFRVLKPGGMVGCIDTTPAGNAIVRPLVGLYFRTFIPLLARIVTGESGAYRYLTTTTQAFKPAREVARIMRETGFRDVHYRRFMAGTIAVHWGSK